MYSKRSLNSYFFTQKGFYVFFIPVKVPYKQMYALSDAAGLKRKEEFGPILESGRMFGFGWVGVEIEKPSQPVDSVKQIAGDFEVYEHTGPYKTLGKAHGKIRRERPAAKEYFHLYLDDPEKTSPADCRTQILFR